MRKLLFCFVCLASIISIKAQVVQGKLVTENGNPISQVQVYVDGSKINTTTDTQGFFSIDVKGLRNANLVFQKELYETKIASIQSLVGKENTVQLIKFQEIEEVRIIPYTEEAYKRYISYFLNEFLGMDQENVKLKNPRSLKFSYDKNTKFLKVKAKQPLIIENKKLGYSVQYDLISFESDFNQRLVSFYGTSFFKEHPAKKELQVNRMNAFLGSMQHFVRSIVENTVETEGFWVNYIVRMPNPKYPSAGELAELKEFQAQAKTMKTLNIPQHIVDISRKKSANSEFILGLTKTKLPESEYTKKVGNEIYLTAKDILQVNFKKFPYSLEKGKIKKSELAIAQTSYLYLDGASFLLFPDGNTSDPNLLLADGDFVKNKVGEMLPLDYKLGD